MEKIVTRHFGQENSHRLENYLKDNGYEAARKAICRDIQRVALDEVAYIPLGSYRSFTATRADLTDRVNGFALFWNLRRI